ncbi:MAG: FecR domain-containing protein, partial [Planctomycetota bacterium]
MKERDLNKLIDSLLEGDIAEADFQTLQSELSKDNDLRREYLDRLTLSVLLDEEAQHWQEDASFANVAPTTNNSKAWWQLLGAAGLVVGTVMLLSVALSTPKPTTEVTGNGNTTDNGQVRSSDGVIEKLAAGYGVISGQDGVVWKDNKTRATGSLLPTGMLQVSEGVVHVELFSGVSLVVEAPAEFAVKSSMQMEVRLGRVRARVPEPAHGFRMSTRDGDIVDLGTDFAVDVSTTRSELHVIEGEVELHPENQATRRLEAGQAVSISGEDLADVRADRKRFLGQEEIASRLESAMRSRRERWLKWNLQLRADPRLVALYQVGLNSGGFRASDRRLVNQTEADSKASDGAIVAATRTSGRWLQRDGALDFSPTGSRVRLTIPGEYQSMTLSCWVKINSLDRWYNSLFLTDGHLHRMLADAPRREIEALLESLSPSELARA